MNLHRNNAAEWVLWVVMLPAFAVVWAVTQVQSMSRR
jgi:hypothetical protein